MSIHRLWAILRKEFRHIHRDARTLFLVTLSPSIMLLTFTYLFATQVTQVRLGVWDLDQTALSRRYVATITADSKLTIAANLSSYDAIREAMMRGDIHLGLVIPPGFQADLHAGKRAPVQIVSDGSDAITVMESLTRFRERTSVFEAQVVPASAGQGPLIQVEGQAWYNRDLDSMFAMVPGLLPIVLILPSLAIALAITREKELGSFETLITTPIRPIEYLLGKLIPYIVYGFVSAAIATLLAMLWFGVPLRGPLPDLVAMTFFYLLCSLSETLFICGFFSSQGTAMRVILLLFFIPSFFLSGTILPVSSQGGPGQAYSFFLPTTYFVQIARGSFLKGMGLAQLITPSLYLVGLGLVPLVLSLLVFRKQVD